MTHPQKSYHSYLLRLWLIQDAQEPIWRASLENAVSGQFFGFANLKELETFLEQLTEVDSEYRESQKSACSATDASFITPKRN